MDITWYGLSCFRITERKQAAIVTDPYHHQFGLPKLKLRSNVVTISHDAAGHNCLDVVSGYDHTITGPGEYEIGGVFITGISTPTTNNGRINNLYVFDYNGMTVAHLGDMQKVPSQSQIEALEQINILLVPVGGGNSLNAGQAAELVSMLEPNIIIPMHYRIPQLKKLALDKVDRFLKEMGVTDPEEESSLRISASKLPQESQTVLLTPKL